MCEHCDEVLASIGDQLPTQAEWDGIVRERAELSIELMLVQNDVEVSEEVRGFSRVAMECTLGALHELFTERLIVAMPEWMAMLGHGRFMAMVGQPPTEAYRLAQKALLQKQMFGAVDVRCRHEGPEHA